MFGLNAPRAAGFVVQPQSLVLESLDHGLQCIALRNGVKLSNARHKSPSDCEVDLMPWLGLLIP